MRIEAGRFKGRPLPRPTGARPVGGRVKSSLFSVLAPTLTGARVLDLCAGVGGLGLEALSRGAESVILVEKDGRQVAELRAWLDRVGISELEARVLQRDGLRGPGPAGPFDLVFLDPPFTAWEGPEAVLWLARAVSVLGPGGRVAVKMPSQEDLPADPRWEVERRRAVGSVAWALLVPVERSREGGQGPMEGGAAGPST